MTEEQSRNTHFGEASHHQPLDRRELASILHPRDNAGPKCALLDTDAQRFYNPEQQSSDRSGMGHEGSMILMILSSRGRSSIILPHLGVYGGLGLISVHGQGGIV